MDIRKATISDLDAVARIYDAQHTAEEAGKSTVGWVRGVYPTRATAEASIRAGDMFVMEEEGMIVAAAFVVTLAVRLTAELPAVPLAT